MPISSEEYLSYIQKELAPLYFKVKKVIIQAENFDPLKYTYIAPLNELRNTLDHIMKGAQCKNSTDLGDDFVESKVHLCRAGYDVYEIFASNLGLGIVKTVEKYSSEVISRVFPQYYTDFQLQIIEIQKELSDVRSKKNIDGNGQINSFEIYEKNIDNLLNIYKTIQSYIPILEKEKRKSAFRGIGSHLIDISIGIIIALIGALLIFKLGWI